MYVMWCTNIHRQNNIHVNFKDKLHWVELYKHSSRSEGLGGRTDCPEALTALPTCCFCDFRWKIWRNKFLDRKTGEMAQQLRALAALPEDLSSIPSLHMAAHKCLQRENPTPFSGFHRHQAHRCYTSIYADKTTIHIKNKLI